MNWHVLKIWPDSFEAAIDGRKNFEVRVNDRDYRLGDVLVLREYIPKGPEGNRFLASQATERGYTGRVTIQRVVHVVYTDKLPQSDDPAPKAYVRCCENYRPAPPPRIAVMGIEPWREDASGQAPRAIPFARNSAGLVT